VLELDYSHTDNQSRPIIDMIQLNIYLAARMATGSDYNKLAARSTAIVSHKSKHYLVNRLNVTTVYLKFYQDQIGDRIYFKL